MKTRIMFRFAVSPLVAAFALARVVTATQLDSGAFNHQYNGDVVPVPNYTDDHIAHGDNPFAVEPSSDGDIMSYRAPLGGPRLLSDDWSALHATGWTIEVRLKVDDDFPEGPMGAFQIVAGDGSNGDIVRIGKNKFAGQENFIIDSSSNTDAFHTFRVALTGGTNTLNMWRDGVLAHTFLGGGNYSAPSMFWASGGSTVGGPTVHIDYFRWDNTGAYEPVTAPPAHPGDFDGDGDVDGADFVAWQTHFPTASGATLADGDADGDGDVDGADFVVWQTNFPFAAGGVAPVPEPTTWTLASLGGLFGLAMRRKR